VSYAILTGILHESGLIHAGFLMELAMFSNVLYMILTRIFHENLTGSFQISYLILIRFLQESYKIITGFYKVLTSILHYSYKYLK